MSEVAFERVKLARDSKRPTGLDYIKNIFKGFIEFHGDRRYADDPAIVGGIAKLNDTSVTVEEAGTVCNRFFDYDDGDFAMSISDSMAMDSDGDLMMRMGDHMAMDMDTSDIHMISSWSDDDEE